MDRRARIVLAAGLSGAAVGGGLFAFFLVRQGLGRASLWAEVFGLPLGLVGTVATVWALVVAVRASKNGHVLADGKHSAGLEDGDNGCEAAVERVPVSVDAVLARENVPEGFDNREQELRRLAAFCHSPEIYAWWQASPWAGKTALAAFFALHPPSGVRVLSFFADSRIPGGATSRGFYEAMIRQLTGLAGAPDRPVGSSARQRRDEFLSLLEQAASVAAGRDERLILLVDGLDEDQGSGSRIVDCLPRHPPERVKVIVSSRPSVEVPTDHPLASPSCSRVELAPSARAHDVRTRAEDELRTHFLKGERRRLLGLIIAAGGGLSARNLAELTGAQVYEIEVQMGPFTRCLELVSRDGERVYQMAHMALKETAERWLGDHLALHREAIHQWYLRYREAGWPHEAADYLLWRYWDNLRACADLECLAEVTKDSARHDRMMERAGSDALALEEVITALPLIADRPDPDLTTIALLIIERERLGSRNDAMPVNLPAVWARLRQTRRAQELARSIPDVLERATALTAIAEVVAGSDPSLAALALEDAQNAASNAAGRDFDRAEKAREIIKHARWAVSDPKNQVWGEFKPTWAQLDRIWTEICNAVRIQHRLIALAAALDTVLSDRIDGYEAIMNPADLSRALVARAEVLASTDSPQAAQFIAAAERALGALREDAERVPMLVISDGSLTNTGLDPLGETAQRLREHAREITRTLTRPLLRAAVLAGQAYAEAGASRSRATDLADEAEEMIRNADEPAGYKAVTFASMAVLLCHSLPDRADSLARQAEASAGAIYQEERRIVAQACVAAVLARTEQPLAADLARQVKSSADAIEDLTMGALPLPIRRPVIRASVAAVLADADLARDAEDTARAIARPSARAQVLAEVAEAFADAFPDRAGDLAREAEVAARAVYEGGSRAPVLARMVWALARANTISTSGRSAGNDSENTSWGHEGGAYELLAAGLAAAHEWDAAECAARAADIAQQGFMGAAQSKIAAPMAAAGLYDRAEAISESAGMFRPRVLASIASALASTDPLRSAKTAGEAVRAARLRTGSWAKPKVFLDTALALVDADADQAVELADEVYQEVAAADSGQAIPGYSRESNGSSLRMIARVLALAGHWDRAFDVAAEIKHLDARADAFADIAAVAAAAKQFENAIQALQAIPPDWPGCQARALASLAGAEASINPDLAGQLADLAQSKAQGCTGPAWVMICAAEALHGTLASQTAAPSRALHHKARQMLALGLAHGKGLDWMSAMPALGKIAPEAITAVYGKLRTIGTPT